LDNWRKDSEKMKQSGCFALASNELLRKVFRGWKFEKWTRDGAVREDGVGWRRVGRCLGEKKSVGIQGRKSWGNRERKRIR